MRHTKSKKGAVAIKLDLDKAYYRLEWSFVYEILRDNGLPISLVEVIMRLVSIGSCRLLWNGEVTEVIRLSNGLRKGDPMSPYLFVLCMEKLGQ